MCVRRGVLCTVLAHHGRPSLRFLTQIGTSHLSPTFLNLLSFDLAESLGVQGTRSAIAL